MSVINDDSTICEMQGMEFDIEQDKDNTKIERVVKSTLDSHSCSHSCISLIQHHFNVMISHAVFVCILAIMASGGTPSARWRCASNCANKMLCCVQL